jgi:hypothetical protein
MSHPLPKKELLRLSRSFQEARDARRQRQVQHLCAAGERPVLECLLDVASGRDLDETLADFTRIPVAVYRAVGASQLPINQPLAVIKGGRDE